MVEAGFYKVFLGIETDDRDSLEQTKKLQNSRTDLDMACRKIMQAGLQIEAGLIVGFDNEKPGADLRIIDFANRNHIPQVLVNLLEAPPGTDLWKRLEKEGRDPHLPSDDATSLIGLSNYRTVRPVPELTEEVVNIYESLYDPQSYYRRVFEEFSLMEPPRFKESPQLPSLAQLRTLLITLFRQGVLYPSGRSFWKYLLKGLWLWGDRFEQYVHMFVLFEHHYEFRKTVVDKIATELQLVVPKPQNATPIPAASVLVAAGHGQETLG